MPSSSNTFGTFLNTLNVLEKQASGEPRQTNDRSTDFMISIARNIAKSGDEKSVKDIVSAFSGQDSKVLATVLEGRRQGLFEIGEFDGESIAKLTPLGKAFVG